MTLILTFILLWFPVHFLATWYRLDESFPEGNIVFVIKLIAHTMSYSISTINPIIYAGFLNRPVKDSKNYSSTASKIFCLKSKNTALTTATTPTKIISRNTKYEVVSNF